MTRERIKKRNYIFLLVIMIDLVLMAITRKKLFIITLLITTFIFSIDNPIFSLAVWVLAYPYFRYFSEILNSVGYFILVPILMIGTLVKFSKNKISKTLDKKLLIFLFTYSLLSIISFTFANHKNLHSLLLQLTSMYVFLNFASIESSEDLGFVFYAYILSGISILIVNILLGNFINTGRMDIGDSIRRVANVTSPGIVIVYLELINMRERNELTILNRKMSKIGLLMCFSVLSIILLSTVSRGSYIAVFLTLSVAEIIFQMQSKKNIQTILKNIIFTCTLVFLAIGFIELTTKHISGAYMKRVKISAVSNDLRWDIWEAGISQMTFKDSIIGAGPNTFEHLAKQGGLDFYAHSVFIDTYVTMGIIGVFLKVLLYLTLVSKIKKNKNYSAFIILLLTVLLYATHGNLASSLDYWTLLGLVVSLLKNYNTKQPHEFL